MNIEKAMEERFEEIIKTMEEAERDSLRCRLMEFRVYIDTDGEVGCEEWTAGDNAWFKFKDGYNRFYIHTFNNQHFDILWDWWFFDFYGYCEELPDEWEPYKDEFYNQDSLQIAVICEEHGLDTRAVYTWFDKELDDAIDMYISDVADFHDILDFEHDRIVSEAEEWEAKRGE